MRRGRLPAYDWHYALLTGATLKAVMAADAAMMERPFFDSDPKLWRTTVKLRAKFFGEAHAAGIVF